MSQSSRHIESAIASQIFDKIMDDWGSLFIGVSFLHHELQIVTESEVSRQRCIQAINYCIYDDDNLEGLPIPDLLHKEVIDWTLHWDEDAGWDDLLDFSTSEYDAEDIKYLDIKWDDPSLPQEAFDAAVDQVDWWNVGEMLDDMRKEGIQVIENAPPRIREYLENAVALSRRQLKGKTRYAFYLATHPLFAVERLRRRGLWKRLSQEQRHAFSFMWPKS